MKKYLNCITGSAFTAIISIFLIKQPAKADISRSIRVGSFPNQALTFNCDPSLRTLKISCSFFEDTDSFLFSMSGFNQTQDLKIDFNFRGQDWRVGVGFDYDDNDDLFELDDTITVDVEGIYRRRRPGQEYPGSSFIIDELEIEAGETNSDRKTLFAPTQFSNRRGFDKITVNLNGESRDVGCETIGAFDCDDFRTWRVDISGQHFQSRRTVPEPSTWLGATFTIGLGAWWQKAALKKSKKK